MKKFIFIALGILLIGLFVFHFIAANQAEAEIDNIIQTQAAQYPNKFSVQYSGIDISPFSGDVEFSNITIIDQSNIERANNAYIDLSYLDFLEIYLGGVEYGLKHLTTGNIELTKVTHLNRKTMQEYALASADITYRGNLWDAIQSLVNKQPPGVQHRFDITGFQMRYTKPNSAVGTFESDSLAFQINFPESAAENQQASNSIHFADITWSPPADFKNKFGFFIQGFGYPMDAIPFAGMEFAFSDINDRRIEISNGQIRTDLFTLTFQGTIARDSTWNDARLAPLTFSVVDMSEKFRNVLANVEKLLGASIPRSQNEISFQLVGPIDSLAIQQTGS